MTADDTRRPQPSVSEERAALVMCAADGAMPTGGVLKSAPPLKPIWEKLFGIGRLEAYVAAADVYTEPVHVSRRRRPTRISRSLRKLALF